MSPKTRSKTRSSRRRVSESLDRTKKALERKREELKTDDTKNLNPEKRKSKKELAYQPHRSKGTKFLDPNRRAYQVSDKGELRAINKPRSRVKRRREEEGKKQPD